MEWYYKIEVEERIKGTKKSNVGSEGEKKSKRGITSWAEIPKVQHDLCCLISECMARTYTLRLKN